MPSDRSPGIVRGLQKEGQVSSLRTSLDCTLNREILPESAPDNKSSSQKKVGGSLAVLHGMSGQSGQDAETKPVLQTFFLDSFKPCGQR